MQEIAPGGPRISSGTLVNTTPALRRSWHVVATSAEVTGRPYRAWLLGEPWCLVRLDGRVAAFRDQCPHRLAPLSAGCVVSAAAGEELQCGYHGWRFDPSGACVAIPAVSTTAPPARAALVTPWGLEERHGLVWLAPDEPLSPLPRLPEWDQPGFDTACCDLVRTQVGAAQLIDNFLDAAHFPFVHAATFGVPEAATVTDSGIERDGWRVATTFATWYREGGSVQRQELMKAAGAGLCVQLRLGFPDTGVVIGILFACTPETVDRTRVYKLVARNDLDGDAGRLARFVKEEDVILAEDLAVLERYDHAALPLDRTVEIHTRADRLSLAWRTLMADLVREPVS